MRQNLQDRNRKEAQALYVSAKQQDTLRKPDKTRRASVDGVGFY
jgi:hypothetical protein